MKQPKTVIFLVATGIAFLVILVFVELNKNRRLVRPALYVKETFTNVELKPDIYDISNANKPYFLLADMLKSTDCLGMLNAKRCYEASFQSRIEKTGNYRQLTNNYRHKDVESCSAPFTEVVNSFYKVEELN